MLHGERMPPRRRRYSTLRRVALLSSGAVLLATAVVVVLFPDWIDDLRRPFRCHMTDVERQLLWRTVGAVTSALERANVTYLMYGGTLLGSFRHHDLIPWDDDVDLLVPTSQQAALTAAVAPLEPDFRLVSETPSGCQWKVRRRADLLTSFK